MSLYDELGVPKSADRATIKRAYRKKAQKLHPDRSGGDVNKFHAIQKAYDVLYDDARRAHYDAHGTDGTQDRQGDLVRRLAALFMQLIEQNDVDHANIIILMKQAMLNGKNQTQQEIKVQEQKIAKYERAKKRLTKKGDGDNLFVQLLDGQISIMRRGLELGKTELTNVDDMVKILEDYQYHTNEGPQYPYTMNSLMQTAAFEVFGQTRSR